MTPAPDDTLPRMVPRDEESARIENEVRAKQEEIEAVLRDRMDTLSRKAYEARAAGVSDMSLPSDSRLNAIIDAMIRSGRNGVASFGPESNCSGFRPPEPRHSINWDEFDRRVDELSGSTVRQLLKREARLRADGVVRSGDALAVTA